MISHSFEENVTQPMKTLSLSSPSSLTGHTNVDQKNHSEKKPFATRNKKLVETSATLVVTGALLVVTRTLLGAPDIARSKDARSKGHRYLFAYLCVFATGSVGNNTTKTISDHKVNNYVPSRTLVAIPFAPSSVLVTTSKALVTRSDALVPSSVLAPSSDALVPSSVARP